ncbi:MAG: DUF721 domain-containing protein [Patescibacteria group bacterium]
MSFISIQKLVPKALAGLGIKREARAALVCERYRRTAPGVVHPEVLEYSFPRSFKNGTLTIGVTNSVWAQEISMKKEAILEEIRKGEGVPAIKALKTIISEQYEQFS